jgi:hypothetical protein
MPLLASILKSPKIKAEKLVNRPGEHEAVACRDFVAALQVVVVQQDWDAVEHAARPDSVSVNRDALVLCVRRQPRVAVRADVEPLAQVGAKCRARDAPLLLVVFLDELLVDLSRHKRQRRFF